MSSGPTPVIPFVAAQQFQNSLSHLFPNGVPNPFNIACLTASGGAGAVPISTSNSNNNNCHRIKMKRCRQRVDAGEPRNSYQSQMKINLLKKEVTTNMDSIQSLPHSDYSSAMSTSSQENFDDISKTENSVNQDDEQSDAPELCPIFGVNDEKLMCNDFSADDLEKNSGSECNGDFTFLCENGTENGRSTQSSSSSRRKSFHPQRNHKPMEEVCMDQSGKTQISLAVTTDQDQDENVFGVEDIHQSDHDEDQGKISDAIEEEHDQSEENDVENSTSEIDNITANSEEAEKKDNSHSPADIPTTPTESLSQNIKTETPATTLPSTFNAQFGTAPNFQSSAKLQEIFEAHRRLYSTLLEQQRNKQNQSNSRAPSIQPEASHERNRVPEALNHQLQTQEIQRNFSKLEQSLKDELVGAFSGTIDKVVGESFNNVVRIVEAMSMAYRQQQQLLEMQQLQQARAAQQAAAAFMANSGSNNNFLQGLMPNSSSASPFQQSQQHFTNLFSAAQNPAFAAAMAAAMGSSSGTSACTTTMSGGGGGIFPAPPTSQITGSPFKAFGSPNVAQSLFQQNSSALKFSPNFLSSDDNGPRKKRCKVTDSVRGPRSGTNRDSLPASERSSPQLNYFPPTMVSHPLYNGFGNSSRDDSPTGNNSDFDNNPDECSDYGSGGLYGDGTSSKKYNLNHVHLRKAKLMFFYTRYPSSTVLKSYFPDIIFNKNNTAQLVKWFSNFREFFYMQMEKYAKQAIAEGIRNKNDITVRTDSEIYKQLNQHYNRNNVVQPPERLQLVIQETLREFFAAIQAGKDAEPSWKKVIYKIIQQLDEPIPEYYKDPNFIDSLEQS